MGETAPKLNAIDGLIIITDKSWKTVCNFCIFEIPAKSIFEKWT